MNRGFTLIELLVVLAIIIMMTGLILVVPGTSDEQRVQAAAQALCATMNEARYASMRSNKVHAVVIHLENAGDGTVMKNFSDRDDDDFPGRHWYALVGPGAATDDMPPYCTREWTGNADNFSHFTIDDYAAELRSCMIGGERHLPRGVRFLALSVAEETGLPASAGAGADHRPWHGWYSQTEQRVYAWGAFNPEMDDPGKGVYSGLEYRGVYEEIPPYDAALDTRVHPGETWAMVSDSITARRPADVGTTIKGNLQYFAAVSKHQGPDTTVLPGRIRALQEGDWGDYMLSFESDGTCYYTGGLLRDALLRFNRARQGVQHRLADEHGYIITLARDIDPDDHIGNRAVYDWNSPDPLTAQPRYDRLQSVEDLLHTITPYAQVVVPFRRGETVVRNMDHPRCHLRAQDLLP